MKTLKNFTIPEINLEIRDIFHIDNPIFSLKLLVFSIKINIKKK